MRFSFLLKCAKCDSRLSVVYFLFSLDQKYGTHLKIRGIFEYESGRDTDTAEKVRNNNVAFVEGFANERTV